MRIVTASQLKVGDVMSGGHVVSRIEPLYVGTIRVWWYWGRDKNKWEHYSLFYNEQAVYLRSPNSKGNCNATG